MYAKAVSCDGFLMFVLLSVNVIYFSIIIEKLNWKMCCVNLHQFRRQVSKNFGKVDFDFWWIGKIYQFFPLAKSPTGMSEGEN